jgi:hypothetical protein
MGTKADWLDTDMDRKQVETLKSVCQHEFGIHISNG